MTNTNKFNFSPIEYHQMIVDKLSPRLLSYDGSDVVVWQQKLRIKLRSLCGFKEIPLKDREPLNIRHIWNREHQYGTIERIVFTSELLADVPAYICLPKKEKPPYTWFVCLQGHSTGMHNSINIPREDDGTPALDPIGDRDFGIGCMKRGIAAICIEQRAFGERRKKNLFHPHESPCLEATIHAIHLGKTLIAERVFDVDRAIDYLYTRDDVNRKKIGAMGNSGGGAMTMFSVALLSRIAFAMPSCWFNTFKDSLMTLYHCECQYVPGLLKYAEMADIMGLFAPKPVVIVAGEKDEIFPIAGARSEFKRLKEIYTAIGASDNCHLVVGKKGHRFYARQAWEKMCNELKK